MNANVIPNYSDRPTSLSGLGVPIAASDSAAEAFCAIENIINRTAQTLRIFSIVSRETYSSILALASCRHSTVFDVRPYGSTLLGDAKSGHRTAKNKRKNGRCDAFVTGQSIVVGHVSASTTLNIYTHVTEDMRRTAASKIDAGIAKAEIPPPRPTPEPNKRRRAPFQPYKGQRRKAGTGCVSQLNDHLWEGHYSPRGPDGKKHSRNVYAHTREECEEKLAALIVQMKAEITAQREQGKECRQVV